MASPVLENPSYLTRKEDSSFDVEFTDMPSRDDVPFDIQENLIIEFYSQIV